MAPGVENDLDNFIFDPTEISLQDYLDEWSSKVQDIKTAAPHISDGKLGFKLLKSLDFPKRKIQFILEHISVDECIKQGTFVNELLTVISTLSKQDWKSTCIKVKPRFEITDDGTRSVNILEDSHFVFLELLMNCLGFEDKKNLCLVSKRMYLRTNKLAPEIGTWRIKLTDTNYRYYISKLRTSPYAEAQKNIDLDVTEYSGSAKEIKICVKDRVTSITGINIKIIKTFVKTDNTLENIKSLSFNGIASEDKLSMIEFLACSEMTPRKLEFTNCDIDRKVMELGFETFDCLEELVVHEDKMKSTSLRILLRKSSKTLRSLEITEPKLKGFNVLVLKDLKFPNLRTVVLDLKNCPLSCYEILKCLSVNAKSVESLKVTNIKNDIRARDPDLPVISFPAMKHFTCRSSLDDSAIMHVKFPYHMPLLTKLDLVQILISTKFLHQVLNLQHLKHLSIIGTGILGDLLIPKRTDYQLESLVLTNIYRIAITIGDSVNVREYDISPLLDDLIRKSANSLQSLTMCEEKLDQTDFCTNLPHLSNLKVYSSYPEKSSDNFEKSGLVRLLNKCYKTLEVLDLKNFKKLNMSHLAQNLDNFPNLKVMMLKGCKEVLNLSKFCNSAAPSLESLCLTECFVNDLEKVKLPQLRFLSIISCKVGVITSLLISCSNSLQHLALFSDVKISNKFDKDLVFSKLEHVSATVRDPSNLLSHCSHNLKYLSLPLTVAKCKKMPWHLLNLSYLTILPRPSPEDLSYLRSKVSSDCLIGFGSDIERFLDIWTQYHKQRIHHTILKQQTQ